MDIQRNTALLKWIQVISAVALLFIFFMPWANWDGNTINGFHFPSGKFFSVAETKFGLANPIPQLSFTFYLFWLIPIAALLLLILIAKNKQAHWPAIIISVLTLSLCSIFFLFSQLLATLGIGPGAMNMLKLAAWLAVFFSIILLITNPLPANWLKKTGWLVLGPLFAFISFKLIEKSVWNETHKDTNEIKAAYSLSANAFIAEFITNDSAANNKYREKIIQINGTVAEITINNDSTSIINFSNPDGSYIAFAFEKEEYNNIKNVKVGDTISVKGSCSGSIFSEILGTTSISFKRATIINK